MALKGNKGNNVSFEQQLGIKPVDEKEEMAKMNQTDPMIEDMINMDANFTKNTEGYP